MYGFRSETNKDGDVNLYSCAISETSFLNVEWSAIIDAAIVERPVFDYTSGR